MAEKKYKTLIVWLRRDLRVHDNAALHAACAQAEHVVPLFVFDPDILSREDTGAARVAFLIDALGVLDANLQKLGGRLILRNGKVPEQILKAVEEFEADGVFHQREYEPFGLKRDEAVAAALKERGKVVETFPGLSLFEPPEIMSKAATPYTVFSPYKREWFSRPADGPLPAPRHVPVPEKVKSDALPTAEKLKFKTRQTFDCGGEDAAHSLLKAFLAKKIEGYDASRDVLSEEGTSLLSRHLHLGTMSARFVVDAVRKAGQDKPSGARTGEHQPEAGHSTFLSEIAWHDFYLQILHHFPHVADGAFRPQYDALEWENDETLFEAWKTGKTGYPIVDAAMRQLNSVAWMHNRGRMIVASFLTKDLLIDWRWGEKYFMQQLVDGDQAANNGGWQWAAGTGTDAQPYFRIFNPTSQGEKFDPEGTYVKRWIPELARVPAKLIHAPWKLSQAEREHLEATDYPMPVVDHAVQRGRALAMYAKAAKEKHEA
ncbi:MAG: cryptochrome/photolyase family protein [Janthinobacterium lividum]